MYPHHAVKEKIKRFNLMHEIYICTSKKIFEVMSKFAEHHHD